jgi:hypothetical protein
MSSYGADSSPTVWNVISKNWEDAHDLPKSTTHPTQEKSQAEEK